MDANNMFEIAFDYQMPKKCHVNIIYNYIQYLQYLLKCIKCILLSFHNKLMKIVERKNKTKIELDYECAQRNERLTQQYLYDEAISLDSV